MATTTSADSVRKIWSFTGRYRILHLTWFAFFLSFVVWFNMAPFMNAIGDEFGLSAEQKGVLGLCNVALTVPARVLIGMALDRWGPRRVYSTILVYAAIPTTAFALATTFSMLVISRLALSIVGAGFVVGIRMVSEWFPKDEVGTAEGVYGGWGNFGSAAAALTLPTLAALIGGWRFAIGATGLVALSYGLFYLRAVSDTPEGATYDRPRRQGALEVTDRRSVMGLALLNAPLLGILGLIAWRLQRVEFFTTQVMYGLWAVLGALLIAQTRTIFTVNEPARADTYPIEDQYPFRSVAILCLAYSVTFGSELAVVSMLPSMFSDTFGLSTVVAGATASAFALMNLVARPAGGLASDRLGSRVGTLRTLLVGLSLGYILLSTLRPSWPIVLAVGASMLCSVFVQSGEGAVYAIVPLVKRRVTGQIAGMVGAYGNVGALVFLTLLLLGGQTVFFLTIAGASLVVAGLTLWLPEPQGEARTVAATDRDPAVELAPA